MKSNLIQAVHSLNAFLMNRHSKIYSDDVIKEFSDTCYDVASLLMMLPVTKDGHLVVPGVDTVYGPSTHALRDLFDRPDDPDELAMEFKVAVPSHPLNHAGRYHIWDSEVVQLYYSKDEAEAETQRLQTRPEAQGDTE